MDTFGAKLASASGLKTRSEIENELGNNNIGSYLVKLEDYY